MKEVITLSPKQGKESVMRFPGIADPEQLRILANAFREYCLAWDIEPGTQAYDNAALHIMAMFNNGALDVPTDAQISKHVIPEETSQDQPWQPKSRV